MIEADDGSLYTGVTTDVPRRFLEHSKGGKGARYFAGRSPVAVVFTERMGDRGEAQRREAAIKRLKRGAKLAMVQTFIEYN